MTEIRWDLVWGKKVEVCEDLENIGSANGWINFSCGRISARRTQSDDSTERGTDFTSLLKPACGMIVEEILRKHLCKQRETKTSYFVNPYVFGIKRAAFGDNDIDIDQLVLETNSFVL